MYCFNNNHVGNFIYCWSLDHDVQVVVAANIQELYFIAVVISWLPIKLVNVHFGEVSIKFDGDTVFISTTKMKYSVIKMKILFFRISKHNTYKVSYSSIILYVSTTINK